MNIKFFISKCSNRYISTQGTVDSFHWQLDADGNDVLSMSHNGEEEIAEEDPRSFLSKKELKILDCINFLRANPSTFADKMMG
jgi:hypothetical protein